MPNCNICGKKIKQVYVVIGGEKIDVNVCAQCLKPYLVAEQDPARRIIIKEVHSRITKKGNSSRK